MAVLDRWSVAVEAPFSVIDTDKALSFAATATSTSPELIAIALIAVFGDVLLLNTVAYCATNVGPPAAVDGLIDGLKDAESDGLNEGDIEGDLEGDKEAEGLTDDDNDGDSDALNDGLSEADIDGLIDGDNEGDLDGDNEADGETDAETDGEIEGLKDGDNDADGLKLGEIEALNDGLIDGDIEDKFPALDPRPQRIISRRPRQRCQYHRQTRMLPSIVLILKY